MSRKTMKPGIIVLAVVLLVAACGRTAPSTTVSDYLASCEVVVEEEIALPTWGDYRTAYAALIASREAIEPPVVLRDFHRATLHALTLVSRAVEEYPPDDPANPLALLAVGLLAMGFIDTAGEALPELLQSQLFAADCWFARPPPAG